MMTLTLCLLLQDDRPEFLAGLRVGYDVGVMLKNGQVIEGRLTAINEASLSIDVAGLGTVHQPYRYDAYTGTCLLRFASEFETIAAAD